LVNHKQIHQLYREEELPIQRRRRKRFPAESRVPLVLSNRADEVWAMDYTLDELSNGRKFPTQNVMDGYTWERLRLEV
jgi:putative transposase